MPPVRRAAAADATAIARLCGQLGYPAEPDAVRARLSLLGSAAGHAVFVADEDGRVLGWAHVATSLNVEYDPRAELLGLVVEAEVRGIGVGASLVDAAEQWAREHGYREMIVRSRLERERAHAFYLRQGYARWKQQQVFRKAL